MKFIHPPIALFMKFKSVLCILAVCALMACDRSADNQRKVGETLAGKAYTGLLFGRPYSIDAVGDSVNRQAMIDSILLRYEQMFNTADPQSTLSRFNAFQRKDTLFAFQDEHGIFSRVYNAALAMNDSTNGFYDPTTAPAKRAFALASQDEKYRPNMDSLTLQMGFHEGNVVWSNQDQPGTERQLVKLNPRLELDLMPLAGACAMEEIMDRLFRAGLQQVRIQYDRGTYTRGTAVPGLNVVSLTESDRGMSAPLFLDSAAFFTYTGEQKPLCINPKTGYPAMTDVAFDAVVAPSMVQAVAFSEAIMAMGTEGMKYYFESNKYSTIEAFVVSTDSLASFTGAFPDMWNRAEQVMKKP
jgi:thiamine biosynthesis lipoprotein ApbE